MKAENYFEDVLERSGLKGEKASVSFLPGRSGDGYNYAGGTILTIGEKSIFVGESANDTALAYELARAWNKR